MQHEVDGKVAAKLKDWVYAFSTKLEDMLGEYESLRGVIYSDDNIIHLHILSMDIEGRFVLSLVQYNPETGNIAGDPNFFRGAGFRKPRNQAELAKLETLKNRVLTAMVSHIDNFVNAMGEVDLPVGRVFFDIKTISKIKKVLYREEAGNVVTLFLVGYSRYYMEDISVQEMWDLKKQYPKEIKNISVACWDETEKPREEYEYVCGNA